MLTAKRIERLRRKPGRYLDGGDLGRGLYLQITEGGASWLLRYERTVGEKRIERWMGLGSLRDFSLKESRERARQQRQLLADGIDPLEQKKAARAEQAVAAAKTVTFAESTQRYFDSHEKQWRNAKHRAQFLSTLKTYAYPVIGALPVAEIDVGLVLKVLEPIWPTKTETASRVRGRIESVLDWATVRQYRKGDNPARWKGHLSEVLPARGKVAEVEHHAALPYQQMPQFMTQLAKREGVAAQALAFLILTAARTGEVIGAQWSEIDLAAKLWTVPAGRMKAGKEHRVPLSDRAIKLLSGLYREAANGHVFIGPRAGAGLSNMAMTTLMRRMGHGAVTVHGFRSSFDDWAHETTRHPNHVIEMALAHTIKNKTEKAYRRGDLLDARRRLMSDWAAYLAQERGKVVQIGVR